MSMTTCNFARAQPITVRRAPIHSVRFALMYRHRHLGGADTEALDRLRGTANECNGPELELVSECDSSARWRRFEIDRERVLAICRFDRSHGGTCAGKPSTAMLCTLELHQISRHGEASDLGEIETGPRMKHHFQRS